MGRFLGIFLFIVLHLSQQISFASVQPLSLRENLRINVNAVPSSPIIREIKKDNTIKVNTFSLSDKVTNMALLTSFQPPLKPDEIIYREAESKYNSLDPRKANDQISFYPGLRGPNQLVIYTPNYGIRTGTNEYGTEAIIENNMVVRLNGADSVIPKKGFVISGHGRAKKWITDNIQIGSKVYIDYSTNTVKAYLTPESLMFAAKEKLTEVNNLIEYYKKIDILYNDKKATEHLEVAKEYLRKAEKKPEKTQNYISNAMEELDIAIKNAIPYNNNELKGVWLRPTEKSKDKIEKTIERLHHAGITDIFLETYFHGKTIYHSKYLEQFGVIPQREEFIGFDPLRIWIDEAHKRNMKIHVWFETYYVGNDNPQTTQNHILNVYPMWSNKRLMNYDSEVPVSSLSEHNGYFLDPANNQVHEFLLNIITEIVQNYKPDGINLDYIRYPQTVEPTFSNYTTMNWGYTKVAREEFKRLHGIDPINIQYGTGDWERWDLYRQNQISSFVKDVRNLTKKEGITLTTVIFPDLYKSKSTKMQNWRMWSINNYIDGVTPLLLTCDKNTVEVLIKDIIRNTSSMTNVYTGLFVPFMNGPFDNLLVQIHKAREHKSKGIILFDYAHFNDIYIEALKTRVFNKSYVPRDTKTQPQKEYQPVVKYKDEKKQRK